MHSARDLGHTFGEAFMLMTYECSSCKHREIIWNSRDGITPFTCGCTSCEIGMMSHIDWEKDKYAPCHTLKLGDRFWRDGTPDEAEAIIRRRIDDSRHDYPLSRDEEERLINACRNGEEHEFQKGWPKLDIMSV